VTHQAYINISATNGRYNDALTYWIRTVNMSSMLILLYIIFVS